MLTQELPLFDIRNTVCEIEAPENIPTRNKSPAYIPNPQAAIENTLNNIFPKKSEENKAGRARKLLGETAKTLSDEQIETIVTEFQFLIETWLDEYEREVFKGLTLKEVINEP